MPAGSTLVARRSFSPLAGALTREDVVSEGGLEPLAYILGDSLEPWLSV